MGTRAKGPDSPAASRPTSRNASTEKTVQHPSLGGVAGPSREAVGHSRKQTGGGSKLNRSQVIGVRLDPRTKYLAELAARKQRRTLSSYIEWAIENSLGGVMLRERTGYDDEGTSIADAAPSLWDVDEPDRFVRLALSYPDLLTHEEQVLWKLIRENGWLWRGGYDSEGNWRWDAKSGSLITERLREHWEQFRAVAEGQSDRSTLPTWQEKGEPSKPTATGFDALDDDIPF